MKTQSFYSTCLVGVVLAFSIISPSQAQLAHNPPVIGHLVDQGQDGTITVTEEPTAVSGPETPIGNPGNLAKARACAAKYNPIKYRAEYNACLLKP